MPDRDDRSDANPLISVLVIATNRYVEFLPELIESIGKHLVPGFNIEVVVFTDQVDFIQNCEFGYRRMNVVTQGIPSYGWPDATLLRYEVFEQYWRLIRGQIVMYLDADTRIIRDISASNFNSHAWKNGVALVQHPGYYGRNFFFMVLMRKTKRGPWESSELSTARVRKRKRKTYVCGGVWMGKNREIFGMVSQLAENVRVDRSNNVIAKWHDESHINNWFVENGATALDPSWAYSDIYPDLLKLSPRIEVITKDKTFAHEKDL